MYIFADTDRERKIYLLHRIVRELSDVVLNNHDRTESALLRADRRVKIGEINFSSFYYHCKPPISGGGKDPTALSFHLYSFFEGFERYFSGLSRKIFIFFRFFSWFCIVEIIWRSRTRRKRAAWVKSMPYR